MLFLGDHHVDAALHAEHLQVLEDLAARGVPIALGLEAVGTQDEDAVRRYLAGDIDLAALRAAVRERWPDSWLDSAEVDADYYRALLALARRAGWLVFALEPAPRVPLGQRDALIADGIRAALAAHPDHAVVVVVGHTHLLGEGDLVGRTGGEGMVVGARMSVTLGERLAEGGDPAPLWVQSDAGVWFPPAAR